MLKRIVVALCLIPGGAAVASSTWQQDEPGPYVYAEVLDAQPVVEITREPVQAHVCHDVEVPGRRSATSAVVGGIVGGLIGNQFGSGSGRTATTIAGAALGATIGNDHARGNSEKVEIEERCERVSDYRESERVVGYRVKYRFSGEIHTVMTVRHPGEHLRLRLSAEPAY